MGYRFRKSIKAGPVRINVSKSGVGYSVGGKGFRYTKKAGGGTRTTVSIPGTGISHVRDSGKKAVTGSNVADHTARPVKPVSQAHRKLNAVLGTLFLVCGVLFIKSITLISIPSFFLGIYFLSKWVRQVNQSKEETTSE